jgi:hypothetical protein
VRPLRNENPQPALIRKHRGAAIGITEPVPSVLPVAIMSIGVRARASGSIPPERRLAARILKRGEHGRPINLQPVAFCCL